MIINELRNNAQRTRNKIYSLFNRQGKAFIRNLLIGEKEVLESFELSYPSAELRRIAHKEKRGTATPEELEKLASAPKKFEGKTPTGLVTNPAAIRVINSYINNLPLISEDLKSLGDKGVSQEINSDNVILGRDVTYWNLHPDRFNIAVFDLMFKKSSRAYVKEELIKMFKLKVQEIEKKESVFVFDDRAEAQALLLNYPFQGTNKEASIDKLMQLKTINGLTRIEYKDYLKTLLDGCIEEDVKFKMEVYNEIKDLLPQYDCRKTEYMIGLLVQYNLDDATRVNSKIDLMTLLAFYRKVEDL